MKTDPNNSYYLDEKINNNYMLNEFLININNLIQKMLEEHKKFKTNEKNKSEIENLEERLNDTNSNIINNSQNINSQYQPNFHIKSTTNIKGLYLNNINNNKNTYDFNDYRDKINIITDSDKTKIKNNENINIKKNQNENSKIKKDNKNNKIYKNELNSNSKKMKVELSRKNSKKKREILSIKTYIKNAKNLFDEERQHKPKTKSMGPNQLEIKSEDNNKAYKDNKTDIRTKLNNFLHTKNRSYTEINLKDINAFSSGNRKKSKNIIINNNNFLNSNIKRKSFNKSNKILSKTRLNKSNNNDNIYVHTNTNTNTNKNVELSGKEKSYYILSNSPILRLKERILFGRSTPNVRSMQTISLILRKNENYLGDKIKELNEKISECDKKINIGFNPSKTAEINFNFILSKDEEELKHFSLFTENESDKKEFIIYMKLIYILFDENFENIEMKRLNDNLHSCIIKKGYKNIKDYLYYLYFKNKENIDIIHKINKINNVLGDVNFYSKKSFQFKFCRFSLFTSFLINEILCYGNNIKNIIDLKIKTKEFIDVIKQKLDLYKNRVKKMEI